MAPVTTDISKIQKERKIFEIENVGTLLANLLGFALIAASLIVFVYLVWGAIDWIISEGDKEKIEAARKKMTAAVIGLIILALVWMIWWYVLWFLGIIETTTVGEIILKFPGPRTE